MTQQHGGGLAPGQPPGAFSALTPEQAVQDLWRFIENPGTRFGTGWSIDNDLGMVGKGELALVIARSGSGKSTWFLNMIANTPLVPTLVLNMEMTPRTQAVWLTAMTFKLRTWVRDIEDVMRTGPEDDRWQEVHNALDSFPEAYPNLHFAMPSRPRIEDIGIMLDDIGDATGVRPVRVIIDHMKFLAGSERGFDGYTRISSAAKQTSLDEDIALFLLQQTSRREGEGTPNDGHLPVKFGSGMYGGEEDADWMFGLYRPERNPKFKKSEFEFNGDTLKYLEMKAQHEAVRNILKVQVIKNRIFSELNEEGIGLSYQPISRRLLEL